MLKKEIAFLKSLQNKNKQISKIRLKRLKLQGLNQCNVCSRIMKLDMFYKTMNVCKCCQKARRVSYYKENKQKQLKKMKQYAKKNPKVIQAAVLRWARKNETNREKVRAWGRASSKKTYKRRGRTDIIYKLKNSLRTRVRQALFAENFKKTSSLSLYLGCSISELKAHLESKFTEGMTWENHGEWHIDHIKPLSLATTVDELYKLCHYENLQPLWAEDNIRKGGIRRPRQKITIDQTS